MSKTPAQGKVSVTHTKEEDMSLLYKGQYRRALISDSAIPRAECLLNVDIGSGRCDCLQDGAFGKVEAGAGFLF
jgi:hypothetical protein